jgi:glycosyltransferase involved in cell wall biosynthesis
MFSIITPTYNRAHTLQRVFDSLRKQNETDFEWIIIDDGSTDNTNSLIQKWKSHTLDFDIIYERLQINSGKGIAVNVGLNMCSRNFTIIADSDDSFDSNTLSDLKDLWINIDKCQGSRKVASIWTLVKNENNELIGNPFPKTFWQVNLYERVLKNKQSFVGEKWHCWRTDVLKKYKIITNPNSFISEGVTWNRINKDYDFLCINTVHRKYWYSSDGIIQQKKPRLKIEKQNYYNSYFQLIDLPNLEMLKYAYYHNFAFNYIKALFYYRDPSHSLEGTKFFLTFLLFIKVFPGRLIQVLRTNSL